MQSAAAQGLISGEKALGDCLPHHVHLFAHHLVPVQISFDLFADLAVFFKSSPDEVSSSLALAPAQLRLKLTGNNNEPGPSMGIAAGSATEAVRKYSRN